MLDLSNPHVLAGADWWMEECTTRLLACGWDSIEEVTSSTTSGFEDGPQSTLMCVAKAVPARLRHHDVAIAQNEVGLLAGKCDMAALLTDCDGVKISRSDGYRPLKLSSGCDCIVEEDDESSRHDHSRE
jgi:hypothetical protein